MKLSIVYNISNYSNNLIKSLKSLSNVKGDDFEIIFIFNTDISKIIDDISKKIDFRKIKVSYVFFDQNLGHSYAYNTGQKLAIGEYIYFAGAKNIFKENFLEELNKITMKSVYDLIILVDPDTKKFTKSSYIKNKNTDLMNIKRKIINTKFILDNKLFFTNYKNHNLLYLFELNERAKKIGYIEKIVCDFIYSEKDNYNLYDILNSSEILFNQISNSSFEQDKKDYYYMLITSMILYDFIYKIFKNYDDKNVIENSIFNANRLIEKIYPEYKNNIFLINNNDKEIPKYILEFKPNIKYCKKVLEIF